MGIKAYLSYFSNSPNGKRRTQVPINSFSVVGGASRTINLSSTTDFLIASEFEQARQYKNITLFMPPAKDGTDMLVAVELTGFASTKESLILNMYIDKYTNDKNWEILSIYTKEAKVTKLPQVVANHELMIEFSVPDLEISYSSSSRKTLESM